MDRGCAQGPSNLRGDGVSGWTLAPLGVKEEAFYVPSGYKVLDPEALLIAAEEVEAWDTGYTVGNAHNGRRDANPYRSNDE